MTDREEKREKELREKREKEQKDLKEKREKEQKRNEQQLKNDEEFFNEMSQAKEEMNDEVFAANIGGGYRIIYKANITQQMKESDAKSTFKSRKVSRKIIKSNGEEEIKYESVFTHWQEDAIVYKGGIIFDPSQPIGDTINDNGQLCWNSWEGWKIEPIKNGKSKLFLSHIYYNICKRNKDLYNYIIDAWANIIQNPSDHHSKIFVMRGDEGAGKSIMMETFMKLLNGYASTVPNSDLESDFNSTFMNKLLVFANETIWAGGKKLQNKLKNISGDNTIAIRLMRTDTMIMKNYCHLWVASNEERVSPMSEGNRRYVVWTVGNKRKNDTRYFGRIDKEMNEEGGLNDLMYYLQNRNITSNFKAKAPVFDEETHREQRLMSMTSDDPVGKWLYYCKHNDELVNDEVNPFKIGGFQATETLYHWYKRWADESNEYKVTSMDKFGKDLTKWVGKSYQKKIQGKPICGRSFNNVSIDI